MWIVTVSPISQFVVRFKMIIFTTVNIVRLWQRKFVRNSLILIFSPLRRVSLDNKC